MDVFSIYIARDTSRFAARPPQEPDGEGRVTRRMPSWQLALCSFGCFVFAAVAGAMMGEFMHTSVHAQRVDASASASAASAAAKPVRAID